MPKSKEASDKYNMSYVYWLINEIKGCVHKRYAGKTLSRYHMSKVVPQLEKMLNDICSESEKY